jgi:hypothetical protein
VTNGEGYSSIQMDDVFKYSIGSTLKYPRNLTARIVYDFTYSNINESTWLAFTSWQHKSRWNLAAEAVVRKNSGWIENHNILGLSFYGKYNITPKYQLFGRYDRISSNIVNGESTPWHLSEDGSAIKTGVQFTPVKNIKMALNYHDWVPWAANRENRAFIYLDLEVKM